MKDTGLPTCKDPSMTAIPTAHATPYKDIDKKQASMVALQTATQAAGPKSSNSANMPGLSWGVAAVGGAGILFL